MIGDIPKVGDPVEIWSVVSTDDGWVVEWQAATVVYGDARRIGVAFADGSRKMVESGKGHWRRARVNTP